ncbi:MAG: hypothetical protein ACO1O1_13185 [Adhaeribacter sp.]
MEQFDIDDFLTNQFNVNIYRDIKEKKLLDSEEDIERFLGLLSDHLCFIKINKEKPFKTLQKTKEVVSHLKPELKPEFYQYVIQSLCNDFDPTLNPCILLIDQEYQGGIEEFRNTDFLFCPDTTAADFLEDYNNYLLGQGPYYNLPGDIGGPYINQWAMHQANKEEGREPGIGIISASSSEEEPTPEAAGRIIAFEKEQVMIFYYLNLVYKFGNNVDRVGFATFVEWALNKKSPKVHDSNIYKALGNPLKHNGNIKSIETVKRRLLKVKTMFESIGEEKIVSYITQDINKLDNDLATL